MKSHNLWKTRFDYRSSIYDVIRWVSGFWPWQHKNTNWEWSLVYKYFFKIFNHCLNKNDVVFFLNILSIYLTQNEIIKQIKKSFSCHFTKVTVLQKWQHKAHKYFFFAESLKICARFKSLKYGRLYGKKYKHHLSILLIFFCGHAFTPAYRKKSGF